MEKLYTSKTILKMAGGRMHTSHSNPEVTNLFAVAGHFVTYQ